MYPIGIFRQKGISGVSLIEIGSRNKGNRCMDKINDLENMRGRLSESTALSPDQQRRLFKIIGEEISYVDNPTFHNPKKVYEKFNHPGFNL